MCRDVVQVVVEGLSQVEIGKAAHLVWLYL